jgi:5-methylcytosine-specific restriction enzyme subunit McrC
LPRDDEDPIVYCERDGTWWAGRYIGTLLFEGRQLVIQPRFGMAVLRQWLSAITHIALVESPGSLQPDDAFIVELLAAVWGRGLASAARHGLPALKQEIFRCGRVLYGRLDVGATVRQRSLGDYQWVSVRRERSLDHAASRAIVAAYSVLKRWMRRPEASWLPPRIRDLISQLSAVTGTRPGVPSKAELEQIRYTPITAAFAPVAELSRQIACQRGLAMNDHANTQTQGVLLDVAELWELYVLNVVKIAMPDFTVRHGTRESAAAGALLKSRIDGSTLGSLRPDILLCDRNRVVGVLDAKYKSLCPTSVAPYGPQREDLYQMAAYLARFRREDGTAWGALVYPADPQVTAVPWAEIQSPWAIERSDAIVHFMTLAHGPKAAAEKIRKPIWVRANRFAAV